MSRALRRIFIFFFFFWVFKGLFLVNWVGLERLTRTHNCIIVKGPHMHTIFSGDLLAVFTLDERQRRKESPFFSMALFFFFFFKHPFERILYESYNIIDSHHVCVRIILIFKMKMAIKG